MRKIHAPAPEKRVVQKSVPLTTSSKKGEGTDSSKKIIVPETSTRYIHELFNQ